MPPRHEIRSVTDGGGLHQVRSLLWAYTAFLAKSTQPGEIDLESRLSELADLPGRNAPPSGAILLALADGEPAGCVAFGPITLASGETVAELRRLWVSPPFRGQSIGRALIEEAVSRARAAGYSAMYLDCLFGVMPAAVKLYRALGFEPTQCYKKNHSVGGTLFFRLDLADVQGGFAPAAKSPPSARSGCSTTD